MFRGRTDADHLFWITFAIYLELGISTAAGGVKDSGSNVALMEPRTWMMQSTLKRYAQVLPTQ
jgi:hypothetical protein